MRELTNREVADLADIAFCWGDMVWFDTGGDVFRARFLGDQPGEDVTDTSVTEFQRKIAHDYQFRDGGLPRGW